MGKLLDEDLIILDADVSTAEDAIRLMASRLQELGYVNEGYAEMVIAREKIFPTGLPGKKMSIAIPHTDPTLVNRPAIGVIVPRTTVEFSMMGEPETKLDCSLLFPLVIKNADQQISLLKAMMGVIQDSDLLEKIRSSKSKKEIIEALHALDEA